MHFFTANSGIKWHYETFGQGEPLVFIHGFGASGRWWYQQKDFLEKYEQDIYSTFEYLKRLFPDLPISGIKIVNIFSTGGSDYGKRLLGKINV